MKIIYQGKKLEERECIGTCHSCKTRVEYLVSECTRVTHDQKDGSSYYVTCPTCGKDICGALKRLNNCNDYYNK